MIEEASPLRLQERIEEEHGETHTRNFKAKVCYLSSSLIVTIPVKVARELGIRLGDRVIIQVRKKEARLPITPQSKAPYQ